MSQFNDGLLFAFVYIVGTPKCVCLSLLSLVFVFVSLICSEGLSIGKSTEANASTNPKFCPSDLLIFVILLFKTVTVNIMKHQRETFQR